MEKGLVVRADQLRVATLRSVSGVLLALTTFVCASCQSPAAMSNSNSTSSSSSAGSFSYKAESHPTNASVRDLSQDEKAGGHILRKHVGQTEEQLRERLKRERNITGASTYTDLSTAEHAVGAAIAQSQGQIQSWLSQPGRHPNLVLDYDSEVPIGRTMNRGENHSRHCEHALRRR